VNAPVDSSNVEQSVPLVLHVVSTSRYHFTVPAPPCDAYVNVALAATLVSPGVMQKLTGENVIGSFDEVDGKWAASPPYIATTSTDCAPLRTSPGGMAADKLAVPPSPVPAVIGAVPIVHDMSGAPLARYDWNANVTVPPSAGEVTAPPVTSTVAVRTTVLPSDVAVGTAPMPVVVGRSASSAVRSLSTSSDPRPVAQSYPDAAA
jgi:hypothetical protein